jgi:hypothetical protein
VANGWERNGKRGDGSVSMSEEEGGSGFSLIATQGGGGGAPMVDDKLWMRKRQLGRRPTQKNKDEGQTE